MSLVPRVRQNVPLGPMRDTMSLQCRLKDILPATSRPGPRLPPLLPTSGDLGFIHFAPPQTPL
jgi:hypothetical protein